MINNLAKINKFKRIIREKQEKKFSIKLHIGCGTNYFEGWINIDNNSDNNIKKLDVNWDLKNPLPLETNTVDFIYNEHFIEHLTVQQGVILMKEFFRVLKPKGVLRIATPDLDYVVFRYFFFWRQQSWFDKYGYGWVKTNAEAINISFRDWGHQYLHNEKELKNRETRKESGLIIEAIK